MRVLLKKWGKHVAVRLPAAVVKAARFRLGQSLEVREEHGRIVLERPLVHGSEVDTEALCATLDPNERPEVVDFGRPIGREIW